MLFTVKEIAAISGITIKTLYHYHKIGLLTPCEINAAGYRFYGQRELERLQQILFYRELDFSLKAIRLALDNESNRENVLTKQRRLLLARKSRLDGLIQTLESSLALAARHEEMSKEDMFRGLGTSEWKQALAEQSDYLEEKYSYNLLENQPIQAETMNEVAREAMYFQLAMADALREKWSYRDERVRTTVAGHMKFLIDLGLASSPQNFLEQVRFHVRDDFHRNLLESSQIGLAYFLLRAVEAYVMG